MMMTQMKPRAALDRPTPIRDKMRATVHARVAMLFNTTATTGLSLLRAYNTISTKSKMMVTQQIASQTPAAILNRVPG